MASKRFAIGAKVQLISGGPVMVIGDQNVSNGKFKCQWFSGKKLEEGWFLPEVLELAEGDVDGTNK